MAVGSTPRDGGGNVPLGCVGVPGDTTPQQLQGGGEYTDANSNITAPLMTALSQDTWKSTFGASYKALAGVAGDLFVFGGSSTKTAKLVMIEISGVATTAISPDISLEKRSTADTAGTKATAVSIAPYDSSQSLSSASATVDAYTAAPTPGTALGVLKASKLALPLAGAVSGMVRWDFTNAAKAPTLRGVAQQLVVVLSAAPSGGSIDISCVWTEE
jgi:hypothetical protein